MKAKKGFTLVELLAVIVVLGVILLIAVPKILDVIDKTRLNTFYTNEKILENVAERYIGVEGISLDEGESIVVDYLTVKDAGYVSEILDPKDKTECVNSKIYITRPVGSDYSYDAALVCDNYIDLDIYNIIENSDFSNGVTEWSNQDCTSSVTDNILTITGTGTSDFPRVEQTTNWDSLTDHKVYFYSKSRVTNASPDQLSITLTCDVSWYWSEINEYETDTNVWYDLSEVVTITSSYEGKFIMGLGFQFYSGASATNGKIMEVDGNFGVYMIDLTAIYGAGNEPTAAEMKDIINNMQE